MSISFATPALVWLAAIAPVLVVLLHAYDRARRRMLTSRLGELPVISRVLASASPGRRLLKDLLIAVVLALVLFAAARPRIAGKRRVELEGLDVVIALDVSKSMFVGDVEPTPRMRERGTEVSRVARARELAGALIDALDPEERIAPLVFAGGATHLPLTQDHQVARLFLNDLGPNDLPPGSNLAEVFRVAQCLLRLDIYREAGCKGVGRGGTGGDPLRGESLDPKGATDDEDERPESKVERGRALVIFTDGGEADAATLEQVAAAKKLGIAVFLVGVGTPEGGVVYEIDSVTGQRTTTPKTGPGGEQIKSRRDDDGMRALAAAAGDERRYLIADSTGDVRPLPIVEALRTLAQGQATKQVKAMKEIYQPFLFAALMLGVIEAAISTRRRRKYPEAA